jgi:hypothetical protein
MCQNADQGPSTTARDVPRFTIGWTGELAAASLIKDLEVTSIDFKM